MNSKMTVMGKRMVFCLATVFLTAVLLSNVSAESKPNVVLLMSDDQGWGEVGYNGHPYLKTPVLDKMASSGLRLDRFYAASPVCTPTRASCMTGRHAIRSGAIRVGWYVRPEEVTVAQLLKKAGYRTAHYGKFHIGAIKKDSPVSPRAFGFDENLSHDNFFEMDPDLSRNGEAPQVFKGEGSEILVKEALEFARKVQKENKPFFIVIWFGSPHAPYSGFDKDIEPYKELGESISKRFAEITAMDRAIGWFKDGLKEIGELDNTLLWFNSDNGITDGAITDEELKYLYNGNLRGKKARLYEGGLLVPGIIEWPSVIKSGRASSVSCVTSDILPTLIDIIGVSHPHPERPLDGISLKKLIVDNDMKERPSPLGFWTYINTTERDNEPWIAEDDRFEVTTLTTSLKQALAKRPDRKWYWLNYKHPEAKTKFDGTAAWIDGQYKLYVVDRKEPLVRELYDLSKDRGELNDIAAEKPELVQKMYRQLTDWQKSVENSLTGADYNLE